MTPNAFAEIVDRAYVDMQPWTETSIAATLALPTTIFLNRPSGGVIAQIAGDDCEILVLATDPSAQRQGTATALLDALQDVAADRYASRLLLEVASRNAAARAFYAAQGFAQIGHRRGYYTLRDGTKDDALLLSRSVPLGQAPLVPNTMKTGTKSS